MAVSEKSQLVSCLQRTDFIRNLESQYSLLDHLENGCLTDEEIEHLEKLSTAGERSKKLISYINESNIYKFIEGLLETNQKHLVNFLYNDGIKTDAVGDEWPLSESDYDVFKINLPVLVQDMDTKSIVDNLIKDQCISDEQRDAIIDYKGTKQDRNRILLKIMKRKSVREFKIFLDILKVDHRHLWEQMTQHSPTSPVQSFQESKSNTSKGLNPVADSLIASTSKEKILVFVGLELNGTVQDMYQLSLDKPNTINSISPLKTDVFTGSAACVVDNFLYAVGLGRARNELWTWYSKTDEWKRGADMPTGIYGHCIGSVGQMIYVLGGKGAQNQKLKSVQCYDLISGKWTAALGELSYPVAFATHTTYNHCVYVFAGGTENYLQVYNTTTGTVTLRHNPVPKGQNLTRAVQWKSKALLLDLFSSYIYDFESQERLERPRFTTYGGYVGLAVDDSKIYAAGGGKFVDGTWQYSNEVKSLLVEDFILDNKQAQWRHHATLPTPALIHAYSAVPLYK